jgi:hypothetical protein
MNTFPRVSDDLHPDLDLDLDLGPNHSHQADTASVFSVFSDLPAVLRSIRYGCMHSCIHVLVG